MMAKSTFTCGGGGGGRINIYVNNHYNYTGLFLVSGGSSASQAGGSGSALITYKKLNMPYNILIIDNSRASGSLHHVISISEGDSVVFSEIHINHAKVKLVGTNLSTTAKILKCDQDSVIDIPDTMIFSADIRQLESTLACSFHLSETGELRLPQHVTFLGNQNKFSGKYT